MDNLNTPTPKKGLPGLAIAGIGCAVVLLIVGGIGVVLAKKAAKFVQDNVGDFSKNPERAGVLMALKLNPAIEVIKVDDAKNSVTFKDKSSGKVMTMSFDDIKQGKISVSDDQGHEVNIDGSQVMKDGKLTMKDGDGNEVSIKSDGSKEGGIVMKGPKGETVIGANSPPPAWLPIYPGATPGQGGMRSDQGDKVTGMNVVESTDPIGKVKEFYETKLKEAGFKIEVTSLNVAGKEQAVVNATKDGSTVNAVISTDNAKTMVMLSYEGPK